MPAKFIPYRYTCFDFIINRIHDIFFDAQLSRSRNLFIRFDLKFPKDYAFDHRAPYFSNCMRRFIHTTRDTLGYGEVYYLAVREQDTSPHSHFHLFLLLDGHRTQNLYGHMDQVRRVWNATLGLDPDTLGLVHYRPHDANNGVMLRRDSEQLQKLTERCLRQAFYLAKVTTKPSSGRNLFSSQVPHRPPHASEFVFPSGMVTRDLRPSFF